MFKKKKKIIQPITEELTEEEKEELLQDEHWGFSLRPKVIPPKEEYKPKHLQQNEKPDKNNQQDE